MAAANIDFTTFSWGGILKRLRNMAVTGTWRVWASKVHCVQTIESSVQLVAGLDFKVQSTKEGPLACIMFAVVALHYSVHDLNRTRLLIRVVISQM